MKTIEYKKNCDCKSTSSTHQIRLKETETKEDRFIFTYAFHPMLCCDKCGEPWVLLK